MGYHQKSINKRIESNLSFTFFAVDYLDTNTLCTRIYNKGEISTLKFPPPSPLSMKDIRVEKDSVVHNPRYSGKKQLHANQQAPKQYTRGEQS